MTNDADICPSPDAGNLARLSDTLRVLDARIRVIEDPAGVALDPHPALLASVAVLNLTTRSGDLDIALSRRASTATKRCGTAASASTSTASR